LRRLRRALPKVGLVNLFGPTETNVCTYYEVSPGIPDERTAPIPIGRACEHMDTFVIDDSGKEVGIGVEGVLWGQGRQSYERLLERCGADHCMLAPDPRTSGDKNGGLAFCTGDYVKLMFTGDYEFLGRRDRMIKTRSFRMELGEIESVLAAHPGVLESVAVPLPGPAIGNRIVASVAARNGETLDSNQLRGHCSRFLSTYMVPAQTEIRSEMIRTSTGKADRQALRSEWEERAKSKVPQIAIICWPR